MKLKIVSDQVQWNSKTAGLKAIIGDLGVQTHSPESFAASLPFSGGDTTAGVENELQAVVIGRSDNVDLSISIRESNYYKNILRHTAAGNTPRKVIGTLDDYLANNTENVWENSWVRFPGHVLSPYAREVFEHDLRSDKLNPLSTCRKDVQRFRRDERSDALLRIPVSYLLKLALADAIGGSETPAIIRTTGEKMMEHFLSDNTSPEISSFYPECLGKNNHQGKAPAAETAKRFFLCQLLIQYANRKFRLIETGQRAEIYFAPQPPLRQKRLNDIISDAFYRELFMSPCLSGWPQGEKKYRYMILCHQVLSRSQLNAVKKLKNANIITNNLVVLPNVSNVSLANNGTHVSLGSKKLTDYLKQSPSELKAVNEKYMGDLAIKIVEHFLPLFVGTYSAAPYRLDFQEFHPEKVLGFLPHELDFTHLRMIWRRWKKKANLNFMGYSLTPLGPEWLDRILRRLLRLKGDLVVDFRLIDYLVALLSTDQSAALDGKPGNDERLKEDLAALGVFDTEMALYMLCRLRRFSVMGFSGFEARQFSLFESLMDDFGNAINLQNLLTALAFKYILKGDLQHSHIPDDPTVESERRQIFFGAAIGIPTFFIRQDTRNRFLLKILKKVKKTRPSHRYPGYIRVLNLEYRLALLDVICEDAADLIEVLDLKDTIQDLKYRLLSFDTGSVYAKLVGNILNTAGAKNPMKLSGDEFNRAAEKYYREDLKIKHMNEGVEVLIADLKNIDSWSSWRSGHYNQALLAILNGVGAQDYVKTHKDDINRMQASVDDLRKLIQLTVLTVDQKNRENEFLQAGHETVN